MKKIQVIILVLFLMGCSSNQTVVTPTATPFIAPTDTPIPKKTKVSPTPKKTKVPTPTLTLTPVRNVISGPTLTPLPTFSSRDSARIMRDWTMGTLNCLLPCWGGIIPGKTDWRQTEQILERISGLAALTITENTDCGFGQCNNINWSLAPNTRAEGTFYTNTTDDMIHFIEIDIRNSGSNKTDYTKDLKIQNIFKLYGFPALLAFHANLSSENNKTLDITLVYPKRQFIIVYQKSAKINGDKAVSCRGYNRILIFILDNKEQLMSFDAIAAAEETKNLSINKGHKSAQEAIGMTNGEFYEYFSEKHEPCISTPVSLWGP